MDRCVLLDTHTLFLNAVVQTFLPGVTLAAPKIGISPDLASKITGVSLPPMTAPALCGRTVSNPSSSFVSRDSIWRVNWYDLPVAIGIAGIRGGIVTVQLSYFEQERTQFQELVIFRQDEAAAVMEMLKEATHGDRGATLRMAASIQTGWVKKVGATRWDDLVLDRSVVDLVKNDFETFFQREEWFRRHRIPFRRGYLLHGPPGNGKTSVIRAMLNGSELEAFTFNFFVAKIDDNDLGELFECAAENAPSMIILEDVDRAFPKNSEDCRRSPISLQQMLNCLDGFRKIDGVQLYCCDSLKHHLPTILMNLDGVDPGDVGVMLDVDYNIATRTGLHCAPLVHTQLGTVERDGGARFSIGAFNTEAEVDTAVAAIADISKWARKRATKSRQLLSATRMS